MAGVVRKGTMTDRELWQYIRERCEVIPRTSESGFTDIKPESFHLVIPNEVWLELDNRFEFDSEGKRKEAMGLMKEAMQYCLWASFPVQTRRV